MFGTQKVPLVLAQPKSMVPARIQQHCGCEMAVVTVMVTCDVQAYM